MSLTPCTLAGFDYSDAYYSEALDRYVRNAESEETQSVPIKAKKKVFSVPVHRLPVLPSNLAS